MKPELKTLILNEIKLKSQIKDLENDFILEKINKFFLTNGNLRKRIDEEFETKEKKIIKSKTFKEIVKRIREEIGIIYGSFLTQDFKKKEKLLEKVNSKEDTLELLKLHKSTRERVEFYQEIYSKIFNWYMPEKIADLACGLNPLSYSIIEEKLDYSPEYFASDLNPADMKFLNEYFNKFDIKGIAKAYDITNLKILEDKEFQTCDLVFLFKALDSFEEVKRGISQELLIGINAKHIIVSFPTKSLVSKTEFKNQEKGWLKKIIEENKWNYYQFEVENEKFFLIEK